MNLITNIFRRSKPVNQVTIPVKPVTIIGTDINGRIECEIETPQFHGSQDKFHLHRQRGYLDKETMKFYPHTTIFGTYIGGDHEVSFSSERDFMQFLVRLL